ncbi:MAG TPA: hypothetical protein VHK69_09465 [Chitinophagaceae bacterium]|jgi:hypothetical protein|nr:hypothetical protein [Chitinophagaceae bacterium]
MTQRLQRILCRTLFLVLFFPAAAKAQGHLSKVVPVDVRNQPLDQVLEILSNRGNFYFSYNSNIIRRDSLVTLQSGGRTVRQVLDILFPDHYEFRETGNYIIIRRLPVQLTLVTKKAETNNRIYTVSGYVLDDATGERIYNASIYEKRLLLSAMTDTAGFFRLRMKSKVTTAALTVSKEFYQDTTVVIEPRYDQQLTITIMPVMDEWVTVSPDDYFVPDSLRNTGRNTAVSRTAASDTDNVEAIGLARFLLSSRQMVRSLNMNKFFTERPFQVSITPGLSTHGKMSGQVINTVSLNLLGGYSGGLNGGEVGGLFNIIKKDARWFQAAGLFNLVGGRMQGLQVGGLTNTVLGSASGLQVGGIYNMVGKPYRGWQIGGVYNHVGDSVWGLQLAGVANYARRSVTGNQWAGVANISSGTVQGMQVSGVFNYARRLRGMQIGLINISDSSDGYSIGLVNIVFKGYHKLAFYSNELMNVNGAFKTGNSKLYSILLGGYHTSDTARLVSFGYGLGKEVRLARWLSINPELSTQYLYFGEWNQFNLLNRGQLHLNLKLGKWVTLFGGPAISAFYTEGPIVAGRGFRSSVPNEGRHRFSITKQVTGWYGWNAGIAFF